MIVFKPIYEVHCDWPDCLCRLHMEGRNYLEVCRMARECGWSITFKKGLHECRCTRHRNKHVGKARRNSQRVFQYHNLTPTGTSVRAIAALPGRE